MCEVKCGSLVTVGMYAKLKFNVFITATILFLPTKYL